MTHSVTCKLNKDARQHQGQNGVTFFVNLGEQSYNFKTKAKEWCNYDAALFAKDGQIQFYADVLKAGNIVTVTATGLLIESDPTGQYRFSRWLHSRHRSKRRRTTSKHQT